MDERTARRISSLSTISKDFDQCSIPDSEIDDPVSAYFKRRCGNSNRSYFKKHIESDSDSSIGFIDVDDVSLFGDGDSGGNISPRLSENLLETVRSESFVNSKKRYSDIPRSYSSQSQIEKQRALAHKTLNMFNGRTSESSHNTPENKALSDISSKLMNTRHSAGREGGKNWFQPNYSPNTPRSFNDELSSLGIEEETLPVGKIRQSQYVKNVNSMLKDLSEINLNSDMNFESRSQEEQINRFEEDEKKFKIENSGVMHNSGISHFSGITGGDISQCSSDIVRHKAGSDKNLSIGQFFNMRSSRVSSLVGSESQESLVSKLEHKSDSLTEREMQKILKNDYSLPVTDTPHPENLRPRRCVSTIDLNKASSNSKHSRYSTDSTSSNSTVQIQNILAEMESGLSGTQIYEKLMKSYGRRKVPENGKCPNKPESVVLKETPKSSKVQNKKEFGNIQNNMSVASSNRVTENKSPGSGCKENRPVRDPRVNQSTPISSSVNKLKGRKGFDSSTPKGHRCHSENFKADFGQVLMTDEDWEVPRMSVVNPTVYLNKSEMSEDNDKTILVNSTTASSERSKKNSTIMLNDTLTIEDTIIAGDLTVLSQRIDEMKGDGVCIVRSPGSKEPVLLTVVQKLASFPKGSVDCSALTPLLRDQFPELLSTFPTPSSNASLCVPPPVSPRQSKDLVGKPGSWVRLPSAVGVKEKITTCTGVTKTIIIPIDNVSQKWLLVSIDSFTLYHPNGQKFYSVKQGLEVCIEDASVISMKETLIPPKSQQFLKVFFTALIPLKMEVDVTFYLEELIHREVQTQCLRVRTYNVNPLKNLNIIPKEMINFGVIADDCSDHRTVQVSFDGACELPLIVYMEENESPSQCFSLKPCLTNNPNKREGERSRRRFRYVFPEGEKQLLEFQVIFHPHLSMDDNNKTQNFNTVLVLQIGVRDGYPGVLQKIPIKGSVSFVKFLCNSSCTPLVFRAPAKGQPVTRGYPLKNVGCLPIAFSIKVIDEETKTEVDDDLFVVPKSFYLSRNEESAIQITFNANAQDNCVKRIMVLQVKPNGRAIYDIELIGIITSSENKCGRPVSRSSGISGSMRSVTSTSNSVPIKLLTTAHSMSWPAVPLEKEVKQTFQIKNASAEPSTVRITFKKNLDSFKLISENGEKVQKIRKVLRPDWPFTVTVAFRPDLVGAHHNELIIETGQPNRHKVVQLCGIGGKPTLFIGNVKSDLNGCKLLSLQTSSNVHNFFNQLEFKNEGRIPGFILIKPNMEVFSLSHELKVTPYSSVVPPDSTMVIKVSQILKNNDIQSLLSGRDISKIATLSVIMGDEPSRLRLRRLVQSGKLEASERTKILTDIYYNEKEMNLRGFDDSPAFEIQFLKSLKIIEVAVVIERAYGICDPSILEDDENEDPFVTFCSAHNSTILTVKSQKQNVTPTGPTRQMSKNSDWDATLFSLDSLSSHNKITKWLESMECPSN